MASAPVPPPFTPPVRPLTRSERRAMRSVYRRRSILGPVVLVTVGVLALLLQMGRLNWQTTLTWYARWWPLLLIAAGVFLAVEWSIDRARQQQLLAEGLPALAPRRVGGGVIWLLVLLGITGACLHSTQGFSFPDRHGEQLFGFDLVHAIGTAHDSDEAMTQAISGDGTVSIDNPQGDVIVSGASEDGQVHISIHKQVYAYNDNDAADRAGKLRPAVVEGPGYLTLRVPRVDAGQADLTVSLPKSVALTVTTGHGQVRVTGLDGAVTVNGNSGDVDLSELSGEVNAHMHSSDATFSAHELSGPLTVDGHTGDVNISQMRGPVTLTGNFFGTTHFEKLSEPLKYHTSRTDLQIARLDGEVEFNRGANLHADQLYGPVLLKTSDRVITMDRVQGDVQVVNTNGAVTLTGMAPLGNISVSNKRGSVDIGVPAAAGFTVGATTEHGEIENDFALHTTGSDDAPELNGKIGNGALIIHVQTSDGDVTLRKISAEPLPPLVPQAPASPAAPAAPKKPSTAAKKARS